MYYICIEHIFHYMYHTHRQFTRKSLVINRNTNYKIKLIHYYVSES